MHIWKKFLQIMLFFTVFYSMLNVWMWWVTKTIPVQPPPSDGDLYKGVAREDSPWLEPWQRWDTPHYQAIAQRGYRAFDTALFTPPLYPLLMWLLAPLFQGNDLMAGLFVSGLAFAGSLIVLYFLSLLELNDEASAWRTTLYIAVFPTAFFLAAVYNESLYLFFIVSCFYAIKKQAWVAAGLLGAMAAFTRLPGALMIVPLAWAAWSAHRAGDRSSWFAPGITAIGILLFPLYVWLYLKISPMAIFKAQNTRGGHMTLPGSNVLEAIKRILNGVLVQENITELFFTVFLIVMCVLIWNKLPRIYGIYSVVMTLFFLCRFGSPQPLVSMARYTLEVFPLFFVLSVWGRNPWVNRVILYLSWIGLFYFAGQFALWGWVG